MQPIGSRRYFLVLACALSLGAAGAHADVSAQPNPPSATPASPPVALPLSAFMPAAIRQEYGAQLDLILDGGTLSGPPSTVVSLVDDWVTVLREGLGPANRLTG